MRHREEAEYLSLGSVLHLVESQAARRAGLSVGQLRVLVRLAALTVGGALVRSQDVSRASGLGNEIRTSGALTQMGKAGGWVLLTGPKNGLGTWALTPRGQQAVRDYASGWRRAARSYESFEVVQPYRRLRPLLLIVIFKVLLPITGYFI